MVHEQKQSNRASRVTITIAVRVSTVLFASLLRTGFGQEAPAVRDNVLPRAVFSLGVDFSEIGLLSTTVLRTWYALRSQTKPRKKKPKPDNWMLGGY